MNKIIPNAGDKLTVREDLGAQEHGYKARGYDAIRGVVRQMTEFRNKEVTINAFNEDGVIIIAEDKTEDGWHWTLPMFEEYKYLQDDELYM